MRVFPLQTALDLAERKAEAKSRLVKQAYVVWLGARAQMVRLTQRRENYVDELGRAMRTGCSADVARQAAQALRQWQSEQSHAKAAVQDARQNWQLALDIWQQESKRVEALKVLAQRHEQAENRLEEKRERRSHDELSLRSAYAWRFAERSDTGFIFPEHTATDVDQEQQGG
jgi:flagellar export protein FliJ